MQNNILVNENENNNVIVEDNDIHYSEEGEETNTGKFRTFAITFWKDTMNDKKPEEMFDAAVSYLIYQLEKTPTTGKLHYQTAVYFKNPQSLKSLRDKLYGHNVKVARKPKALFKYCAKEESRVEGPWEFGKKPKQGERSDIKEVTKDIIKKKPLHEIATKHAPVWVKFHKGFKALMSDIIPARGSAGYEYRPNLIIIIGPPAVGKSRMGVEYAKINKKTCYTKPSADGWWPEYRGEEVVIINEFEKDKFLNIRDDIEILLNMIDWYSFMVPYKGGHTNFAAKTVILTTNDLDGSIKKLFFSHERITRRITLVLDYNEINNENEQWIYEGQNN